MSPQLQQALTQLAAVLGTTNPQAAREIQQYVASGGTTPLSTATMATVEASLRSQGLSVLPNAGAGGTPGRLGPGATPSIQHNAQGQPTGYVPGDPGLGAKVAALQNGNPNVVQRTQELTPPGASGNPLAGTTPLPAGDRFANQPGAPGFAGPPTPAAQNAVAQATMPPPPGGGAGGGGGNPGGFNAGVADVLGEDDDYLLRFALQSAGFNPDIITPASRIAAKYLAPMVTARRSSYGLLDPSGGNKGGLPQDIAAFAKEYTDKGANFYGNAAEYAKQILGGAGFGAIGGIGDQEKRMGMYQALIPLLYGGANPLVQQSVGDQTKKLFNLYKDQDIMGGPDRKSVFEDYLKTQQLSPLLQSIFGRR